MDGAPLANLYDVCGSAISASVAKSMIEKGEKLYSTQGTHTAATAGDSVDNTHVRLTASLYDANGHEVYKSGDILKVGVIHLNYLLITQEKMQREILQMM